jgi:hypothetical protein
MKRFVVKIQSPRSHKKQRSSWCSKNKKFYKGYLRETCCSIESSQSLKANEIFSSGKPNVRCEENDVLNS